jgi:hypothetical protein
VPLVSVAAVADPATNWRGPDANRVETVVLLADGQEPLVHDAPLPARPDGRPAPGIDLELLAAISARGQAPRVPSASLPPALQRLAAAAADELPDAKLVPVKVASGGDGAALAAVATGVLGAIRTTGRRVAVLADGQLPGPAPAPDRLLADARRLATATSTSGPWVGGVPAGWAAMVTVLVLAAATDMPVEMVADTEGDDRPRDGSTGSVTAVAADPGDTRPVRWEVRSR